MNINMEELKKILKTMHPDFDFESSDDFVADELLDSFDVIELVANIEEIFDVKIDGLDILPENFCNYEAIRNTILKNGGKI